MDESTKDKSPSNKGTNKTDSRTGWITLLIFFEVIVVVMLVGSWIPVRGKPLAKISYEMLANKPEMCATCHIMGTRYTSFRRSSHAEVAVCMDCHSDPGFIGEMEAHLDGVSYLYALVTGSRSGTIIKAEVSNESCLDCHPEYLEEKPLQAIHIKAGGKCSDCHDNLMIHRSNLIPSLAVTQARNCNECHEQNDLRYRQYTEKFVSDPVLGREEVNILRPPK